MSDENSKTQKDLENKANELGDELSEDDIAAISGGNTCVCILLGMSSADSTDNEGNDDTCACTFGGAGLEKNRNLRCVCPLAGGGEDR
ncbi:MAG: hypothetical protein LBL87_00740 [Ruminococcus sp.]|jgi:hypothetical protein|nr:hypothetical protein [Ruminococcus sp.]